MDELITIWDFSRKVAVIHIPVPNAGVHSFVYSTTFQTLITAGFENVISLWNIHPIHFDYSKIGRLVGHSSFVTAVEVIENTPMVISADDVGSIKVWDIRNQGCLQTLEMGGRTVILKLLDMYDVGKLCFVGSRVNILNFDEGYDIKNKLKAPEYQWPIQVEYNFSMNEIVVCTKKEVKILDANTGRVKKIYAGLLGNTEDDITTFRMVQQNKKFILGDQRGNLGLYLHQTGELLQMMNGHTNEVSAIKIDYINRLIISSSWDSSVIIQKELKDKFKVTRKITNCHFRKEIFVMETSVYHNIIVTAAARSNVLYIYDYEYIRLIGSIEIEEGAETTCIQFINGYAILLVSTNVGTVHFFHFVKKDIAYLEIKHIAVIDANKYSKQGETSRKDDTGVRVVTKLLLDVGYDSDGTAKPEEAYLYIALSKGMVIKYHIESIFADPAIVLIPHANARSNYNAERITNEDFEEAVKNYKIYTFNVRGTQGGYQNIQNIFSPRAITFGGASTLANPNSLSPHASINKGDSTTRKTFHLSPFSLKDKQTTPDANSEASEFEFSDSVKDLSQAVVMSFQAHKDVLTTLNFIVCPEKKLLTSSLDYYIRIWDLDGTLLASVNINHPLPVTWNLETNSTKQAKKRVLYAMKIIETIFKRYDRKIALLEEKRININHFLAQLDDKVSKEELKEQGSLTERKPQKLILMADEYEPRDIQFEKVKGMYHRELQGPTLRQMEISKRLMLAHKLWKQQATNASTGANTDRPRNKEDLENFNNELMGYLLGDPKETLNTFLQPPEQALKTRQLKRKLVLSLKKPLDTTNLLGSPKNAKDAKQSVEKLNITPLKFNLHDEHLDSPLISPPKKDQKRFFEAKPQPIEEHAGKLTTYSKRSLSQVENLNGNLTSAKERETARIEDLSTLQTTARKTTERDEDHSLLKSGKKTPLQNTSTLEKKRNLPPILNFYEYANHKQLLSPDAKSARSQLSTDPGTPKGPLSQRDRKTELQAILSTLDRKLKKSQLQENEITFKTIIDESKRKKEEERKEQLRLSKMKSQAEMKSPLLTKGKKSLPSINFKQNLENFKKNMDHMIQEMLEGAKESISEKVARRIEQKLKLQAKLNPDFDYELLQTEGKKQGFVPLGVIFKKLEAIDAVADDFVYKKTLHSPNVRTEKSLRSGKGSTTMIKDSGVKRSYGDTELEQIRNTIKFDSAHKHPHSFHSIAE